MALQVHLRRGATLAATLVTGVVVVLLAATALSMFLGYRMLTVRSDSMAPALRAGDVIVTRLQRPATVAAGTVVTFADHTREGRLITHRVVERDRAGGLIQFTTRGDANDAEEQWAVASDGRVGALVLRVPRIGFAVSGLTNPYVRIAMMAMGALLGAAAALRRIWAL